MATGAGGITLQNLPRELSLEFIKKITCDFSEQQLIGTGASGSVYKGILDDGGIIAVKRLAENSPLPLDKVFENEVQNVMALEHENILKMVAYCREAQSIPVQSDASQITAEITETLLCYEFLPKGSLDQIFFGESSSIDWDTRFKIIKGICQGIHFLHTCPKPILHLGMKPQNILLDNNMTPKIADFGFSKIFGQEQSRMDGLVGYMAPEYLYNGEISTSLDIYSLGLIILEICTREKNNSSTDQMHARNYIDGVRKNWILERIMCEHPDLDEDRLDQVAACIEIGLQCVEIDQTNRPSIDNIVGRLNGE